MIRGTTPTLEFTIPFDTNQLAEAWITFSQLDVVVLNKTLTECQCDGNKISIKLTQEDTLQLNSDSITNIQIRARTIAGDAFASNIINRSIGRILKDGVI